MKKKKNSKWEKYFACFRLGPTENGSPIEFMASHWNPFEQMATKKSLASHDFNEQYQNVRACQKKLYEMCRWHQVWDKKKVNACAFEHTTHTHIVSSHNVHAILCSAILLLDIFVGRVFAKTFQEFLIFDLYTFTIR